MDSALITQLKILRLSESKSNFSELARKYDVDRRTIKKYYDGYEGKPVYHNKPSKLDKHKALIEQRMKFFARYKVLVIDEIGYMPIDADSTNLFFQLIARRYEKHCTIITTNAPFSKWNEIFSSATLANAILDRLLHHSIIISIKGSSYRLKEKRALIERMTEE